MERNLIDPREDFYPEYKEDEDKELKKNIKELITSQKRIKNMNVWLKRALDLPTNSKKLFLGRAARRVLPKTLYNSLPDFLMGVIMEEPDILVMLEQKSRQTVNDTQLVLKDAAACAIKKQEELDSLEDDLETAEEEKWSAQELQQHMAKKVKIKIYDEVSYLLDKEFRGLTDEEKEERKEKLLDDLRSNIIIGYELMDVLKKVCLAGLEIFQKAMTQYFNYMHTYRPLIIIRDAAEALTNTNNAMYLSKKALETTFKESILAIESALQVTKLADRYSIVAPDMQQMLQNGKTILETNLKSLRLENDQDDKQSNRIRKISRTQKQISVAHTIQGNGEKE